MIEALEAIQTHFNEDAALAERFPEGCYLSMAPDAAAMPVCRLTFVSSVPDYNTGNYHLNTIRLQFDVFADTDTEALQAAKEITTAFNFATLDVDGTPSVLLKKINQGIMRDDERVWHSFVEFELWLGEANS